MRLFIAINFSNEMKAALLGCINQLADQGICCNFTADKNLHLTLAFIGETNKVSLIKNIINEIKFKPFNISLKGYGYFHDLLWIGIEHNPNLLDIAIALQNKLLENEFNIKQQIFKPHITIARKIQNNNNIKLSVPSATCTVNKISLMKSSRINGKIVYTEIL